MTGDDLQNLAKKYPVLTGSVVIFLLSLAWLYFRTDPIDNYKNQISTFKRDMSTIEKNAQNGVGIADDVATLKKIVDEIDGRLMDAADTTENYSYFFSLENRSGATITDPIQLDAAIIKEKEVITAFQDRFSKKPVRIIYELDIKGSFPNVLTYLHNLVNGTYFNRVKALKISQISEKGRDVIILSITLEILGKNK